MLSKISSFVPLSRMVQLTNQKVLLPFYHLVSDNRLAHISNLYQLRSIDDFENDLIYLLKYFKAIDASTLYSSVVSEEISKPVFHLTFDDGLSQIYNIVAPILERKNIPATFFVNTDFIDNKGLFYRYKVSLIIESLHINNKDFAKISDLLKIDNSNVNSIIEQLKNLKYSDTQTIDTILKIQNIDIEKWLCENKPYLSSSQINDLITRGFKIGSHSVDHPRFKYLTIEEQKNQITSSFTFLERNFGIKERFFSFPFSDEMVPKEILTWLSEDQNCKLSFGISGLKKDVTKTHLQRLLLEEGSLNADKIISSEYLYYMLKSILNKNRIKRK